MPLPRCCSLVLFRFYFLLVLFSRRKNGKAIKSRVICQAFALPRKGLKKTLDEAQAQAEAEGQSNFYIYISVYPLISYTSFVTYIYISSSSLERTPGNIDSLADLLLSDLKNFPTVQELGESSARFIREELEKTWGSSHLSILSEQEAQKWLLGVCVCFCF